MDSLITQKRLAAFIGVTSAALTQGRQENRSVKDESIHEWAVYDEEGAFQGYDPPDHIRARLAEEESSPAETESDTGPAPESGDSTEEAPSVTNGETSGPDRFEHGDQTEESEEQAEPNPEAQPAGERSGERSAAPSSSSPPSDVEPGGQPSRSATASDEDPGRETVQTGAANQSGTREQMETSPPEETSTPSTDPGDTASGDPASRVDAQSEEGEEDENEENARLTKLLDQVFGSEVQDDEHSSGKKRPKQETGSGPSDSTDPAAGPDPAEESAPSGEDQEEETAAAPAGEGDESKKIGREEKSIEEAGSPNSGSHSSAGGSEPSSSDRPSEAKTGSGGKPPHDGKTLAARLFNELGGPQLAAEFAGRLGAEVINTLVKQWASADQMPPAENPSEESASFSDRERADEQPAGPEPFTPLRRPGEEEPDNWDRVFSGDTENR